MGIMYEIKEKRTLLLLAVLAGVIAFSFLLMLTGERAPEGGPEVISKRVKIEIPEEHPLEPLPVAEQTAPEPHILEPAVASTPEEMPAKEAETELSIAEKAPAAEPLKEEKEAPEKVARLAPKPIKKISKPKPAPLSWAVNVASFTHEKAAEDLKRSLIDAGYKAYITKFKKNDTEFHRVRVGFYSSKNEAEKVSKRLARTFNIPDPWVVKPARKEVRRFSK